MLFLHPSPSLPLALFNQILYSGRVHIFTSGSLLVDLALPHGGIPQGEVVLLRGPHESGKTWLCLNMLAASAPGAMLDPGAALELDFARRCGMQIDRVYYSQPRSLPELLDCCETLLHCGALRIIVIDSPEMLFGDPESADFSQNEQIFSAHLLRLARLANQTGTILAITQHHLPLQGKVYHDLAQHLPRLGPPLRAGVRLDFEPRLGPSSLKPPEGLALRVRLVVSGWAISSSPVDLFFMYNQPSIKSGEIFCLGTHYQLIQSQATAYEYQGQMLGTNRFACINYLVENPEVAAKIEQEIRSRFQSLPGLA